MSRMSRPVFLVTSGVILLFVALALVPTAPAEAQCGSQASSCKNCHEVQGQDPVNSEGDWHTQHAFGDFCAFCHAGNVQATDAATAHIGMVPPMSDVNASCQQCHPGDLDSKAQAYAGSLGVEVNASVNSGAALPPNATSADEPAPQPAALGQPSLAQDDPNLVDYVQRYNENVLGKHPANWGNLILLGMIAVTLVGGGSYVAHREGLVRLSFKDTKPLEGDYPADIVEMVPHIAKLKPSARKALRRLLHDPEAAEGFLTSFGKLTKSDEKKD